MVYHRFQLDDVDADARDLPGLAKEWIMSVFGLVLPPAACGFALPTVVAS